MLGSGFLDVDSWARIARFGFKGLHSCVWIPWFAFMTLYFWSGFLGLDFWVGVLGLEFWIRSPGLGCLDFDYGPKLARRRCLNL